MDALADYVDVRIAITRVLNNNAVGAADLTAEPLKCGGEDPSSCMHEFLCKMNLMLEKILRAATK